MKSLALSLLVALGVSLGTVTAFAEPTRAASGPSALLSAASASMQQAQVHAERAAQYRLAARVARLNATNAMKVVENDVKQGFTYEAGVERGKALKYEQEAQTDLVIASREDAIAAQYRAQAQKEMAQYQQALGTSAATRR